MNTFKKRIDELGRIVIPKEIRKSYKINNYDELDLTTLDDKIIITKSIGIKEYKDKIKRFIFLINKLTSYDIIITDKNDIIETSFNDLHGKLNISFNEEYNNFKKTIIIDDMEIKGYIFLDKIIIDSNLLGYIIFINKDSFFDIILLKNITKLLVDIIN